MERPVDAVLEAYDFAAPPLVRFGAGRIHEIGDLARPWGRRAWLVGGRRSLASTGVLPAIEMALVAAGVEATLVAESHGEPTVEQVAAALAALPEIDPGGNPGGVVVVAVGGGATIDLAKAVAALATNLPPGLIPATCPREALEAVVIDHLEGVGRGLAIRQWPLPLVAVPTTAGTGAEATRNAVISCPRRRFKKSMRSPLMVPRAALLDPDLTASCDRVTIAASGLDCVTQLIESFVCRFRRPLPRGMVLETLPRALAALPRVLAAAGSSDDVAADRAALSHAAFVSGLALANSGLGLAHGVAAALGVACGTPHGVACALMLPVALRVNREAAGRDFATLERAVDPGAAASDASAADAFVARIDGLCRSCGLPRRLSEIGVTPAQLDWLADNSGGASMRGNPVHLEPAALRAILAEAL
jgi:alcohol dehydrogenase class IV